MIESLDYCIKNKGMILYGSVIMSNHIHLIIQSEEGKLSDLIRDFKKFLAKSTLEKIQNCPESRREWMLERFKLATQSHSRNKEYQFWQYGNHAGEIYTNGFMWSKLDYIYSSANNYIDNFGLLTIVKADNPIVNVLNSKLFTKHNQY